MPLLAAPLAALHVAFFPTPTPPGANRYHCNQDYQECVLATEGHSTLAKCQEACGIYTPSPPATPTPADGPTVTGVPCDSSKWEQSTAFNLPSYLTVDLATLPSPLNTNGTTAGRENFCCLYCVRDSRCQSWTIRDGRMCSMHAASPGSRQRVNGAVSGTPLPRVPDISADPQGALECLPSYTKVGPYAVTHQIIGSTSQKLDDTCTPCWMPKPDGARYLVASPKAAKSQKMPVYIWLPAEGQPPTKYRGALDHIASHGFVVLSPYIDYSQCRSNLCNSTGAIYRNNSYPPSQKYACQRGQCVPSQFGRYDAASCSQCGPIKPKEDPPTTTCTVKQVVRGEEAVRYALNNLEKLNIDATLPIGIGGASATAPQAVKVVAHLTDDEAANVGALVLQHPSFQPSHAASLDSAFDTFKTRARKGQTVPAMLGLSGYLCARLVDCAPVLMNKPCRAAAAASPPDQSVLDTCGDCTDNAGRPVAWEQFVDRYAKTVKNKVAAASVSGPWHHWVPQDAGENPTREGCGTTDHLPETSVVIAWLEYSLKGDTSALSALKGCDRSPVSMGVDGWILPRLNEDRLRKTPAGTLLENAINQHGTPLQVSQCHIAAGRVATHIQTNFTGV